MATRVRNRTCPKCGELFSSQGLAGHLRFVHHLDQASVRDVLDGRLLPERPDALLKPASIEELDVGRLAADTGWVPAIILGGLAVLAAVKARKEHGPDRFYCSKCKQGLNVSEARRRRVSVVQCPRCGQMSFVAPMGPAKGATSETDDTRDPAR